MSAKSWYWLSFCDPAAPAGSQFLGVAIVEADDLIEAAARAWLEGINPGGEILGNSLASL